MTIRLSQHKKQHRDFDQSTRKKPIGEKSRTHTIGLDPHDQELNCNTRAHPGLESGWHLSDHGWVLNNHLNMNKENFFKKIN